jgi:hypothetical protein
MLFRLLEAAEMGLGAGTGYTVVPGFEHSDHDLLMRGRFEELITEEQAGKSGG